MDTNEKIRSTLLAGLISPWVGFAFLAGFLTGWAGKWLVG